MRRALVLVVPLLGVAVLGTIVAIAGGRDEPTLFERVAAHPERFRDRSVRVTGRIVARPSMPPLNHAFVLEGAGGRRLLVLSEPSVDPAAILIGARVAVRGAAVALRPSSDELAGDLADLAGRFDAVAILKARTLAPRPG